MEDKYINKILNFSDKNICKAEELVINKEQAKKLIDELHEDYIPKAIINLEMVELKEKMELNKKELKKNPDPVNSKFYSFDEYFKWKNKVLEENEMIKFFLKYLKQIVKGEK